MSEPCYVYVLVNPADGKPFYIGISNNPWYRFYSHQHDRCSAAWDFLNFLTENEGFERNQILTIYRKCESRSEAFDLEHRLVTSTPGLLNRPYRRGRAYA
ncbi:GIY-YIG nuclease family protein [Bradyrhizobium sp. 48]|uniref:GIY-YIG nuclease family protein n=1 Tax=Bradyrhizobium sp. 48 TaxID=2782676 RepID=UPI001FF8773E|nr:GIY-YIG nuclease family protein [Bradyrhizobium sp. 48]MCK1445407.1 GIY-YIG nuclease family protein [Bradyrhizobium sp. 48]